MFHSIVVGINRYSDPRIGALSWARSDAESIASIISAGLRQPDRQVSQLFDEDATKRNINVLVGEELPRVVARETPYYFILLVMGVRNQTELPTRHLVI